MGDAGDRLAEYELKWADGVHRCASKAHGWLNGEYPSPTDGKVEREVCFAYNGQKCWQRTKIKMKNCGSFSVYLLNGMSYYVHSNYLRYCGVGETGEYFSKKMALHINNCFFSSSLDKMLANLVNPSNLKVSTV